MADRPELSVVVPFYNERDNVAGLLAEIDRALAGVVAYEVVAVDDGSTDGTHQVIATTASASSCVYVIRLTHNQGQSAAIARGIQAASAPLIATLDGDGQNPPADIVALLQGYRERVVVGVPLLIAGWRQQRNDGWLRRLSARLANRLRGALLRDGCPDTGCGLKLFARDDFLALPRFAHMHRFLPALFIREGGHVCSVPVAHRPRCSGRSKYGVRNRLWVGLVDLAGVCWLQRRACGIGRDMEDA